MEKITSSFRVILREMVDIKYVYHGTSTGAVRRIQREGLQNDNNRPIYFSSREDYAETYAKRKDFRGGIMLRTPLSNKIKPADNIEIFNDYIEYYTRSIIEAKNIDIKINNTWKPLIKVEL